MTPIPAPAHAPSPQVVMVTNLIVQWQDLLKARRSVHIKKKSFSRCWSANVETQTAPTCNYLSKTKPCEPRGQAPVRDKWWHTAVTAISAGRGGAFRSHI
ncbi:hypothetical protein Bbelb_227960 [Branchiostoma belcheri]|nr:hypothetical protein Bbelb_227960 [Branchiostoma belcheri]